MLLFAIAFASIAAVAQSYRFAPEKGAPFGPRGGKMMESSECHHAYLRILVLDGMPVPYNLSTSQTLGGTIFSGSIPSY
jgi:hypothetical protein